ncbi:MAG: ribonuclease D [Gemmatimonadales bacterium]|nr:ribonuclease D [Gemmatimonadales bacterium]NIN49217.1 ribonuclease D [Gemmatimonadales bacterium]NIP06681.1 ribonuclease D [Gemmatimonadales bacterium]
MMARQSRRRPQLIAEPSELVALATRFSKLPRIGFDTEAASYHRYVDRVYLVQLSSDDETALVDPLAITDLGPLAKLLADRAIEIVFHDADYDLRILDRDYGFRATNLFDTRIAAQLAGEPSVGLRSILEKYFRVRLDKKYQRADWSRRPLTPEMIAYASDDTRYLPALRDKLATRLTELGRLEWALEEFQRLEGIRWTQPRGNDEDAYLRIKGAKSLGSRQRAVLRALYAWRESTARTLDRAPFRVLGGMSLVEIARAAPTRLDQLSGLSRVPSTVVRRYGQPMLAAVKKGLSLPAKDLPRLQRAGRPEPDHRYDQRIERLKRLRDRRAREIGMEPGLLCPNGTLQVVARAMPASEAQLEATQDLRRWQRQLLGDQEILAALSGA